MFSEDVSFSGRIPPEEGILAGYGAIINTYKLKVPPPIQLSLISTKNHKYTRGGWLVFGPKYMPAATLQAQLTFAIKYEGIDLLIIKKLFEAIPPHDITEMVLNEPTGIYIRKIWFLYEWLTGTLPIEDTKIKKFVTLVDENLQYASIVFINSTRHRIKNNLPGNINFCPMVWKTPKLEYFIEENLSKKTDLVMKGVHKDILLRTSAFLLLKDSKASFSIEGENPSPKRAIRWGQAIGQAGNRQLNKNELLRLQQIIIESSRFIKMGYRAEGGFIGEHDRITGEPIPDHISAKWQDIEQLMDGLLQAAVKMEQVQFHPVLTAAIIAFGFVFIHPLVDGNGRLHRYLVHHLLAIMKFTPQGIIFPVSAAILEKIDDYRKTLEQYSLPLLELIDWRKTNENNIEVFSDTIDYYRYFNATRQAEFLFECVAYTINTTIPQEVAYLQNYDAMKSWLDNEFQMPDKMVALLINFLHQNNGILSKRAKEKEFTLLSLEEISNIESTFRMYFNIGNITEA